MTLKLVADSRQAIENRFHVVAHALTRDEVIRQLSELFDSNLILAWKCPSSVVMSGANDGIKLTRDAMLAGWDDVLAEHAYYLTQEGAAQWSSIAMPNWLKFYSQYGVGNDECEEWAIETATRERAEELFLAMHQQYDVVFSNEEALEPLEPWNATYWKVLPKGFRLIMHTKGRVFSSPDEYVPTKWPSRKWCERGIWADECHHLVKPGSHTPNEH